MEEQIEELNCPICMMVFKRPLTIMCGHSFCSSCLTNSLREHHTCPICRQHIASTPAKTRPDEHLAALAAHYRRTRTHADPTRRDNQFVECKAERLLLVDVQTEDLLLPYNRITATFELQSSALIDRMTRFVARQEPPFNRFSVLCRLVHFEEMRKNLYKGVLEGAAFCSVESEEVESEMSLEDEDEEFFYRTCQSREISETAEAGPQEFAGFFSAFEQIKEESVLKLVFARVDHAVFVQRNDSLAVFYSLLGLLDLPNHQKYALATAFNEDHRLAFLSSHLKHIAKKIRKKPEALIRIPADGSIADNKFLVVVVVLLLFYLFAQVQVEL